MLIEDRVRKRLAERDLLDIVKTIAKERHVLVREVLSDVRLKAITAARHEVWRVMHERHDFSYPEMERLFERAHETIWYGVREAERKRSNGQTSDMR